MDNLHPGPSTGSNAADAAPAADVGEVGVSAPHAGSASNRIVPDAVAQRFLRIDDRYFFPDRTLAFVDTGTRLKVRTDNLEVVHSVVAIVQARGWSAVQLTGTPEFRRTVWHEATLQGIGVQGYSPSALEMQQLQRALDQRQAMDRTVDRTQQPTSVDPLQPEAVANRAAQPGLRPPMVGRLLAHAAAPYRFDPAQRLSYYVRVQTEAGERTIWGSDLERAVAESRSHVHVGDEVVLRQRGARPVPVRIPDRDEGGDLVGERKRIAQRMSWHIETVDYIETRNRHADLIRSGALEASPLPSGLSDLSGALAGMKLAEKFAQRLTPCPETQARLIQAIRTGLADAITQGREVRLPPHPSRHTHGHHRGRTVPALKDPLLARG